MIEPTGDTLTFQINVHGSTPSHTKTHTHVHRLFLLPTGHDPLWTLKATERWAGSRGEVSIRVICSVKQGSSQFFVRMLRGCRRTLWQQINEIDDSWTCLQCCLFWPLWKHSMLYIVMVFIPASSTSELNSQTTPKPTCKTVTILHNLSKISHRIDQQDPYITLCFSQLSRRGVPCGTRCGILTPSGPPVVLPAHFSTNPDTYTVPLIAVFRPWGLSTAHSEITFPISANLLTDMLSGQPRSSSKSKYHAALSVTCTCDCKHVYHVMHIS